MPTRSTAKECLLAPEYFIFLRCDADDPCHSYAMPALLKCLCVKCSTLIPTSMSHRKFESSEKIPARNGLCGGVSTKRSVSNNTRVECCLEILTSHRVHVVAILTTWIFLSWKASFLRFMSKKQLSRLNAGEPRAFLSQSVGFIVFVLKTSTISPDKPRLTALRLSRLQSGT